MKKNFNRQRNYTRLMRGLILQVFLVLPIVSFASVFPTSGQGVLQRKITLSVDNEEVKHVLRKIEETGAVRFVYQPQVVNTNRKVSLAVGETTIAGVLNRLFDQGIVYEDMGDWVVIKPMSRVSAILSTVSGRITDAKTGESLPGVNVAVKGTTEGTVTDDDGKYTLTIDDVKTVLVFSYVGYLSQEIPVGSRSVIDVQLAADEKQLEEVVVVGYGTRTQAKMTSAVSQLSGKDLQLIPTTNLSNVLAGRFTGAFVSSPTGTPGIGSAIKIRSRSSFSNSAVEPLYVIDGVVRDKISFDALDPNEVADITILKDAASAAIYGSRSSNGAILVTTKTGKSGDAVIQFNTSYNMMAPGKMPEYMPVKDALYLDKEINGNLSDEEINWVLENNPKGENFYNAAYTNPNSQRYALNVSGGSDKIRGFIGTSYVNENGFLPQVWYKKYNLRGNIEADLVKNLSLGLNVSTSYGTRNRFNFTYDYGSDDLNSLWGQLLYWDVFATPYIDGKPNNPGGVGNPVEMMRNGGYWRNTNQQIDALLTVEYKIPAVPGLSVKATFSKNFDNSYVKTFAKKHLLYNFKKRGANNRIFTNEVEGTTLSSDPGVEYLGNEYKKSDAYQLNGYINYERTFGKHSIEATAVYEQYEGFTNGFHLYRNNFPLSVTDQFLYTSKDNADWGTGGGETEMGRLSYIGRLNYDYDSKYVLSASVRRDGSTNFAPHKRWGWFPSVSAAWVISEENFFRSPGLSRIFNFLKIRGSFAATGNDILDKDNPNTRWSWQEQYIVNDGSYYLGANGVTVPLLSYGGIPNPDLTWEKSYSSGVGLEATILKNIRFTFDYWQRRSVDILGFRTLAVPNEFGGAMPPENYGKVNSQGLEMDLSYGNNLGKSFTYNIKGLFTYATNKVILQDVAANTQQSDNPIGNTLAYGTGFKALGILRTQEDLDKLPADFTINGVEPALGDMLFADISGPYNVPDNRVDDYDDMVLGNYFGADDAPISVGLNLSLSYKGFSVDALLSGLAGFKKAYRDPWDRGFGGGGKVPTYHADSWSEQNPNGSTPKLYKHEASSHDYGYRWTSTFNVYDGSFLRMKYVNLSYKLPDAVLSKAGIKEFRIFLQGQNLFTLTGYHFYDPEVMEFMSYPIMKTFTMGIDCRF